MLKEKNSTKERKNHRIIQFLDEKKKAINETQESRHMFNWKKGTREKKALFECIWLYMYHHVIPLFGFVILTFLLSLTRSRKKRRKENEGTKGEKYVCKSKSSAVAALIDCTGSVVFFFSPFIPFYNRHRHQQLLMAFERWN